MKHIKRLRAAHREFTWLSMSWESTINGHCVQKWHWDNLEWLNSWNKKFMTSEFTKKK